MTPSPSDCIHLSVEVVREIHREVLAEFGGPDGVRDQGLLESAVAAPQASVAGESPFRDLVEIAAAYLFYLCRNHPFVDGNKRTAMAAAIVFLRLNGVEPSEDGEDWEELLVGVASSRLDRNQATLRLRRLVGRRR